MLLLEEPAAALGADPGVLCWPSPDFARVFVDADGLLVVF